MSWQRRFFSIARLPLGLLLVFMLTPASAVGQEGARELATADLVEKAGEAVVLIRVQRERGASQGSGFLADPSGLIVTNHHVIEGATAAQIELPSGETFERVQVLDVDPRRDLAVLRVPGFGLPHVTLGNSDSVRVGDRSVVIGSPLGLENTVSAGIVSARRELPGYQLLQITAPISPGSSGGPVFGPDGRVIGVAVSQLQQGQNLNFAVPVNYVRGMLNFLPDEPKALLTGYVSPDPSSPATEGGARRVVNEWLEIDAEGFRRYEVDLEVELDDDVDRHEEYSYRLIGKPTDSSAILERFVEYRVTFRGRTIEQGTMRSEARVTGLIPVSAHYESRYLTNDNGWQERSTHIEFENGRARGEIADSREPTQRVNREIPPGTITRDFLPAAIALARADSLLGTTWTVASYDPREDEIVDVRVSFEGVETVEFYGEDVPAFRTVISEGATRNVSYYRIEHPRILVGSDDDYEMKIENVEGIDISSSPDS